MEKWYETWKSWVATKNLPLTLTLGDPSVKFKIIFEKNF